MGKVRKNPSLSTKFIPKTASGRKKPKCGRCFIHGDITVLEGHKKYCPHQMCKCLKCYHFLSGQRVAADKIAQKRAYDLSKVKKISKGEIPPSLFYSTREESSISNLLTYTLHEMYKSFTVWRSPTKIEQILRILIYHSYKIDSRIKFNGFLEIAKYWIFQVIHEEDPMSFQQATCCYVPSTNILHTPNNEQLVGSTSYSLQNLEYSSHYFPVWSSNFSSITNSSLETLKSPSELSESIIDPCIDPSTEPSTDSPIRSPDSPTDLSTESSTYC